MATTALPNLCWPLSLDLGGSKGPNAQEVCAQATFEGRISPRDKWQEMGPLGEVVQRRERGLGGPEMEQPAFWEEKAKPASQQTH